MKRSTKIVLGVLGVAVAGGAVAAAAGGGAEEEPTPDAMASGWADEIVDMVARLETATGPWPGLATYLILVAYWEASARDGSPPNLAACRTPCGPESERGPYQIRPASADIPQITVDPSLLFQLNWATAAAAWLTYRLATRYTKQIVTMRDLRRGWKYPRLVDDFDLSEPESPGIEKRFTEAIEESKMAPLSFRNERVLPEGFMWPGVAAILKAVEAT